MTEIISELQKGGIVMIPLLLGSILTLAIVIERAFSLRVKKIIIPEIVTAVEGIKCPEDIRVAERICETYPGTFANVMLPALRNQDLDREELKEFIIDQGRQEVRTLERGLVGLETVAGVAPLLGLMGTVLGMIKVFNVISQQGRIDLPRDIRGADHDCDRPGYRHTRAHRLQFLHEQGRGFRHGHREVYSFASAQYPAHDRVPGGDGQWSLIRRRSTGS